MKKLQFIFLFVFIQFSVSAQEKGISTEKVWRVNFLNPAIEVEVPTGNNSTFSTGVGVGYGGGYPDLTYAGNGFIYIIGPFLDIQQKWFYNLKKRSKKDKSVTNNSGNFISVRILTRGPSIADNVIRTSDFDFAFGPTWGIQRSYNNKIHFLFDIGPIYYTDLKGNGNIFPIMAQINIGLDL